MSNIQAQIDALAGSIKVLDTKFSNITGNTFSNYNQLSRIIAQQGNIYNTLYFGSGNIFTENLVVQNNLTLNNGNITSTIGNLTLSNGNITSTIGNLTLSNGNILSTVGNIIMSNGNIRLTRGNLILTNGHILSTAGNIILSNGNIGLTRGNLILINGDILSTAGNIILSNGNIGLTRGNLILTNGNIISTIGNLILTNGNLGIKKNNPAFEIDVTGNINFTGDLYQNGNIFDGVTQWSTVGSTIYYNSGNVGIGTITPVATLDVAGNTKISGNVNIDNGTLWVDNINNRVGILNTNPQYTLDVKGLANVSSNIFCDGISTDSTQTPLKIFSGNITTNGSGYYNFAWTQFINTPYLVITAISDQPSMRIAFIRTISKSAANVRVVGTDNIGLLVNVNYIVMGY